MSHIYEEKCTLEIAHFSTTDLHAASLFSSEFYVKKSFLFSETTPVDTPKEEQQKPLQSSEEKIAEEPVNEVCT